MSFAFEVGRAYIATPTVRDAAPQRVFEVARRKGADVTLVDVRGLHCIRVEVVMGRETAKIRTPEGVDYLASAAVPADVAATATAGRATK